MAFFDRPSNCPTDRLPMVQLILIVSLFLLPLSAGAWLMGGLAMGPPNNHPLALAAFAALVASPFTLAACIVLAIINYWFYTPVAYRSLVALPIIWWAVFGVGCIGIALSP